MIHSKAQQEKIKGTVVKIEIQKQAQKVDPNSANKVARMSAGPPRMSMRLKNGGGSKDDEKGY